MGEVPDEDILKIDPAGISIIPKPQDMILGTDYFTLPNINVICSNSEAGDSSEWLSELLSRAKLQTQINSGNSCGTWNLNVDTSLKKELGNEGYTLEINAQGIFMNAASPSGLFYAIQTLRQILPSSLENNTFSKTNIQFPHLRIKDVPDHSWRGTMVDISRSFLVLTI
jgi:hexosaminidase